MLADVLAGLVKRGVLRGFSRGPAGGGRPASRCCGIATTYYAGPGELLASGYMWDQDRKQLAYKPFEVVEHHGRGFVIGFTADRISAVTWTVLISCF